MDRKLICKKCGIEKSIKEFWLKNDRKNPSWCKVCLYTNQKERWKSRRKKAIDLSGGGCSKCGYNKNYAALDFHHLDPNTKEFDWSKLRLRSWESILEEIRKCILLCANCHREEHNPDLVRNGNFEYKIPSLEKRECKIHSLEVKCNSTGNCPICSAPVFGTTYCSQICVKESRRKVKNRPSKEELLKLIKENSWTSIAKDYQVSDNAVRKWAKQYGIL